MRDPKTPPTGSPPPGGSLPDPEADPDPETIQNLIPCRESIDPNRVGIEFRDKSGGSEKK